MFKINKIARNFLSVGFANLISQFLTFFTIAIYARILTVDDFGKISLAQSIIVYFIMFTLYGFQTYGTREVAKRKDAGKELVSNIMILRFFLALVSFGVIVLLTLVVDKGIEFKILMLIYGLTLFPLMFNIDWFFSGIGEMQYNAIYNILKNLIPLVLIVLFLKKQTQTYLVPTSMLIGLCVAVIFHIYVYKFKKKQTYTFNIDIKEIKNYLVFSFPFFISGLLSMINCNIDSIIIGFMRSEKELGIYSSAYKIIFFLTNLMSVIFIPVFPLLIDKYHKNSKEDLKALIQNTSKIVVMLAFPICFGGILLSKEIIILLFGSKYIEAYLPFRILMIYILILFMRETYGYSLNAWNMEKKYLKVVASSALINLILNIIFIPIYGINAAAVVTVFSEMINFYYMRKYSFTVLKNNYLIYSLKVFIPLVIMCINIIILKYMEINLVLIILLSMGIYFSCIIIFKYITIGDLKTIIRRDS